MGSAQLPGQLQAVGVAAHGDDLLAAGNPGGHDGAHAHGAAAKYRKAGTEFGTQPVEHRTCAGLDTAAQRGNQLQINIVAGQLYGALCVDHRILREGGLTEERGDGLSVLGEAGGPVGHDAAEVDGVEVLAGVLMTAAAVAARSAEAEGHADLVADLELTDVPADFHDFAAALVTQHRRQGNGDGLRLGGLVGVAYAAGSDLYKDLIVVGSGQLHFLDGKGLANAPGNGSFHFHFCPAFLLICP